MKIILDTNIYLASLLNQGLCFELLELVLGQESEHQVFISKEIWLELKSTILKKKLADSFYLAKMQKSLENRGFWVEIKEKISAVKRDPSDNKILECGVAAHADLIITMDKDLLKLKSFRGIGIIHPKTLFYMTPKQH